MTAPLKILLALGLLLPLAACGGFALKSDAPAPVYYRLEPLRLEPAQRDVTLVLRNPDVRPGLDTDHIVLTRDGGRILDFYENGYWPDTLAPVLRNWFEDSLQARYRIAHRRPATSDENGQDVYRLDISMRDFQAEYAKGTNGLPRVHVAFDVTLLHLPDEQPVTAFRIAQIAKPRDNTMTDVTAALNDALKEGTLEMIRRIDAALPAR